MCTQKRIPVNATRHITNGTSRRNIFHNNNSIESRPSHIETTPRFTISPPFWFFTTQGSTYRVDDLAILLNQEHTSVLSYVIAYINQPRVVCPVGMDIFQIIHALLRSHRWDEVGGYLKIPYAT
jgi:hypothetical protein